MYNGGQRHGHQEGACGNSSSRLTGVSLPRLMLKPKEIAVIGLGRFGRSVARTLSELGAEVLAIDKDAEPVQDALEYASEARQLDATNTKALDEVGIEDFGVVIVCIEDVQSSVMISLLCLEKGVQRIITKAQSDLQANLLERIGVKECVFPERSAGEQLAERLMTSDIMQSINLSEDYATAELRAHPDWIGHTLGELGFRRHYGLNVIALRRSNTRLDISPTAEDTIGDEDLIYVIGTVSDVRKIEKKLEKDGIV